MKTALVQLESARVQVAAANLGVQLAKEEVGQARDRFRAGVANNIEVITGAGRNGPRQRQPDRRPVQYNQAHAPTWPMPRDKSKQIYSK